MDLINCIKATNAEVYNFHNVHTNGISTDSRTSRRGELFIAIKGERFDGHDFVKDVIGKGATAVIISKEKARTLKKYTSGKVPVLIVEDTLRALGDIARCYRMRFNIPVIGITGSTGKTTTKEILNFILSSRYKVLKNEGTKNNLIGLPLTLLNLRKKHEICVLEMGTNRPGEIERLAKIASPSIGIITNIGNSHLEGLGNLDNVFREKRSLFDAMDEKGYAVLNKDDRYISRPGLNCRKVYFSMEKGSGYRARCVSADDKGISFKVRNTRFSMPLLGRHNVYNVLAAAAASDILGVNLKKSSCVLKKFRNPFKDRLTLSKSNDLYILNDTYNSNPVSFESAVTSLSGLNDKGRRVVISSDMLELGRKSDHFHRQAGRVVADSGIDFLVTVGDLSRSTARSAVRYGMDADSVIHFNTRGQLKKKMHSLFEKGDVILVKGSRAMHMEEIIDSIKEGR